MATAAARPVAPATVTVAARSPIRHPAAAAKPKRPGGGFRVVTRRISELVAVVPDWAKAVMAALAALALALGAGARLIARNNRGLEHRRAGLAEDVGALEAAVIPDVPRRIGGLLTSVARRSEAGPAAGGSFYDVFPLATGRVGVVLGRVPGGAESLAATTLVRHTLRALLEAEPVPRRALQTADRLVGDDLAGTPAAVVVAVHDRRMGTLSYACAGHPAPVLLGPPEHVPVLPEATAPLGSGGRTGVRQTTVLFPTGSLACFYNDGRTGAGALGHERLVEVMEGLGPLATAGRMLAAVSDATGSVPDDMVACVLRPAGAKAGPSHRVEELELTPDEVDAQMAKDFMRGCGLGEFTVERYDSVARRTAHRYGGATGVVARVCMGAERPDVQILVAGREWPYAPAPAPAALVG